MAEWIGIERRARRCYGFDEIALVPGKITVNPAEVDTTWKIDSLSFRVPFIAEAMKGTRKLRLSIFQVVSTSAGLTVILPGTSAISSKP